MLKVKNLQKKFGATTVLNDITIDFPNTAVIVGLNGAGKTVFLNSITGISNIDSGSVELDGFKIGSREFKERIFYIPSDFYLPHYMTGSEYADFIMNRYPKSSSSLFFEISSLLDLTNFLNTPIESYSFGMKKKLQLAIMFSTPTPYILADEVFSGLDLETSLIVRELFTIVTKSRNLVLVSHEKDIILHFSDCILVMKNGQLSRYKHPPEDIENFIKKEEHLDEKINLIKQRLHSI
ncbi:abc transporter atp-binding protein [Ligilactobacillus murinus DSM 20452 = NBRC 14221]|uniref:Abc transporter atp-binding protein n=1 Tax=Ligilactobacillus murinus DSM 20452 = NBRC 14221 TaxID=1423772 RepID=A0A0R2AXU9_9LACO|nr:ABC transporter ATP-binding protein [Ligilactobacillus murinus]KRM70532.1 abc transporter atp-binding protein [Ligilactobacillus murinus DSM 20452 = NBRC 14221]